MFDFLIDDNSVSVISFIDDLQDHHAKKQRISNRTKMKHQLLHSSADTGPERIPEINDSLTTSYTDRENGARELHSWAAGLLGNRARLQSASLAPSTEPCPLYAVMEVAGDPASLFHRNKD